MHASLPSAGSEQQPPCQDDDTTREQYLRANKRKIPIYHFCMRCYNRLEHYGAKHRCIRASKTETKRRIRKDKFHIVTFEK